VQSQLLPVRPPELPGTSLRGVCRPAASVGGDYFDFVSDGRSVTALVADVSGHGVGPGLMMAMTRTALRRELTGECGLPSALEAVNHLMWDDMVATGLFITLFCIRYDSHTGVLSYVNAGHHPALLRRADGVVEPLDGDGYPVGLIPDPSYEETTVVLGGGDAVLLFTDGVVEERSATGTMFGSDRLTETVGRTDGDIIGSVLHAVEGFRRAAPQQDDITLVELRRERAGNPGG
jgi:sigma-B regulation protein RsbU (phosphoserine phosphatase)